MDRLLDAWRHDLRCNEHLLPDGLDRERPLWVWEGFDQQDLVYFPLRFTVDHGGQTKAQMLAADPSAGWQVLLTGGALRELPLAGQGWTLAGRRQIEDGQDPVRVPR